MIQGVATQSGNSKMADREWMAAAVEAWRERHWYQIARAKMGIEKLKGFGTPDGLCEDCPTRDGVYGSNKHSYAYYRKTNPWCCHADCKEIWGY